MNGVNDSVSETAPLLSEKGSDKYSKRIGLYHKSTECLVLSDSKSKEKEVAKNVNQNSSSIKFSEMPSRKKWTLALCTAAITLAGISFSLLGPFYPIEAAKKGMSMTMIGFVIGVFEIVIFITSPFYGNYLTTIGPKFVYVAGIIVGAVCNILFGVLDKCPDGTPFTVMCVLCRSVEAMGYSAFITANFAIVSAEFQDNVGLVFGILEAGSGLGFMIGPSLGGALYELAGYGLPFYFAGAATLINGLLVFRFLPDIENISTERKSSVFGLCRSSMVFVSVICIFVGVTGIATFGSTMAQHLVPFGLGAGYTGLLFGLSAFMYSIMSYLWGYISETLDIQGPLIVAGHGVFALGFLIIGPSPLLPFIPYKLWAVCVGVVCVGMSFGCALIPTMKCMVKGALELGFDNNIDTFALISGLFNSIHCLGGFVGPTVMGALVQEFDYPIAYTVVSLATFLWMIVVLIYFKCHKPNKLYKDVTIHVVKDTERTCDHSDAHGNGDIAKCSV